MPAEAGLVVEDAASGFCGAVLRCERDSVELQDARGRVRAFPLRPAAFLVDGDPVTLVRPPPSAPDRRCDQVSVGVGPGGADASPDRAGQQDLGGGQARR